MQPYINLKVYGEFAAQNRPHGWNYVADNSARRGTAQRSASAARP
jgi:hypothetical protein